MQYRPEIDGLRALAVLPVMLFHAGISGFNGGYAGVDVFFVISGYLITAIIMAALAQDRFSLKRFYVQRARRILPALYTVTLACIPFAWAWLPPEKYESFCRSAAAAVLFVSNIVFGRESGYFESAAEDKPLLHTWSLGIEGQFYLLFPLLLVLLWRYRRSATAYAIAGLAISSFCAAEYVSRQDSAVNFFMTVTRAWELFAGALGALILKSAPPRKNQALSALGLGAVVASFFLFDATTRWPSAYTLLPVGGTALVILYAGQGTLVRSILSLRPLVGLGLISYSAYLWHQPLFAFARIRSLSAPSEAYMLGLAALSLMLAWGSWRYIETPFYRKSVRQTDQPIRSGLVFWPLAVLTAAIILTTAQTGISTNGLPDRPGIKVPGMLKTVRRVNPMRDVCNDNPGGTPSPAGRKKCWLNDAPGRHVAILGDSHADAMAYAQAQDLGQHGLNLYQRTRGGCPVVFDVFNEEACLAFNRQTLDWLENGKNHAIDTVIVAARWPYWVEQTRFDNTEGGIEQLKPRQNPIPPGTSKAEITQALVDGLNRLLDTGKTVIVVYPIPEAGWDVPQRVFKQLNFKGEIQELSTPYPAYIDRNRRIMRAFDGLDHPDLVRFFPHEILCDADTGRCLNANEDIILYMDDDHLSQDGAAYIAPGLTRLIMYSRKSE